MNLFRNSIRSILAILMTVGGSLALADDENESGGWATLQSAEMIDFMTGAEVKGGGTLLRSRNAVEARLSTMGLDANAAYTLWWVIFNRPSKCSMPGCGEDDIFSAPGVLNRYGIDQAQISVVYAAGFVTGSSHPDGEGVANVTAHLNAGKLPAGWGVNFGWKNDRKSGLKNGNGTGAELHMVVRSHGPAMMGEVGFQTSNFDGPCAVCEDQQAIIFNPL